MCTHNCCCRPQLLNFYESFVSLFPSFSPPPPPPLAIPFFFFFPSAVFDLEPSSFFPYFLRIEILILLQYISLPLLLKQVH